MAWEIGAPPDQQRRRSDRDVRRSAAHERPRDAYRDIPILQRPTWNHEVAAYFYFGGISAGSAVLGSLSELFAGDRYHTLTRVAQAVSFAALLPCPPLLIDDLGMPSRFHHMLRIFKPSSPMNLGAWTLTVHGSMVTLQAMRMLAVAGKLPVAGKLLRQLPGGALAAASLPAALTLGGYTGVLLGTTSVPVWSTSPLLGALFMASSLNTGTAATSLVTHVVGGQEAGHDPPTLLSLSFGSVELAVLGGYLASSGRAAQPLFRGRGRLLLAGTVAATVIGLSCEVAGTLVPKRRRLFGAIASGATLVAGACLRWSIVRAGAASAADREGTLEAMAPRPGAPGWGNG